MISSPCHSDKHQHRRSPASPSHLAGGEDHPEIRQLFDDYLRMYSSRDDRLTEHFSEDFSGFTGGGDFLVKDRQQWVAITRQDFAQVKDPIHIELHDLAVQSLADTVAVATGFFTIHLPIEDHILSRETARLVLIFRKEPAGWKISHSSISIPYHLVGEGEVYPLKELAGRNQELEEMIAERTQQLCAANEKLLMTNMELAREMEEREQADEALRESEAHYRLMTENVSDVVWKVDSDYRLTYISPADERVRGFKAEEMIGRHVFELFDDQGIALLKKLTAERLELERQGVKSGTMTFEAQHRCKDGSWLWAELNSTPDYDADGKIIGYYGVSREITERRLAEDETRRAKAAAEEAHRAKSQFLAVMSHEIRTPLNALVGFSTLARKEQDSGKLDQYHAIIEQSARSLMELTNNILDMSKIEAGRLEVEAVPFNLRRLVASLQDQYGPLAGQKMLAFRLSVADDVPVWMLGDPVRLQQILANLLCNAVKFTERGSVCCSVSLSGPATAAGQHLLRFEVKDTGVGIPQSWQSQLFLPFHQLDPSVTRKFGGTGLGLAIVQSLATMMGGTIEVESSEGVGSCFVAQLPFQEVEAASDELLPPPAQASSSVLVVEDNPYNRRLLEDILTAGGHRVTLAEDGLHALDCLLRQRFDVVLLDVRMPDIDGIEVARRVRRLERHSCACPIPIIAITADADAATREACLAAGINAVLTKPINPEQLSRALATHLGVAPAAPSREELALNVQTCTDLGDNSERARQYREMLLQDIEDELQCLQVALERDDRGALGRAAHTLKGLCGHLANREPAELAARLQLSAATARPEQVRTAIEQLRKICRCEPAQEGQP
jgi:PAS domain S-box-containing protein